VTSPSATGSVAIEKTIGIVAVSACRRSTGPDNHRHLTTNQIGGKRRQSFIMTLNPAVFDGYVS
jgi:hypothetical protein